MIISLLQDCMGDRDDLSVTDCMGDHGDHLSVTGLHG